MLEAIQYEMQMYFDKDKVAVWLIAIVAECHSN
jgi:hypothetical protein